MNIYSILNDNSGEVLYLYHNERYGSYGLTTKKDNASIIKKGDAERIGTLMRIIKSPETGELDDDWVLHTSKISIDDSLSTLPPD